MQRQRATTTLPEPASSSPRRHHIDDPNLPRPRVAVSAREPVLELGDSELRAVDSGEASCVEADRPTARIAVGVDRMAVAEVGERVQSSPGHRGVRARATLSATRCQCAAFSIAPLRRARAARRRQDSSRSRRSSSVSSTDGALTSLAVIAAHRADRSRVWRTTVFVRFDQIRHLACLLMASQCPASPWLPAATSSYRRH